MTERTAAEKRGSHTKRKRAKEHVPIRPEPDFVVPPLDPWATIDILPGYDSTRLEDGYEFDPEAAERAVDFFHRRLTHVKGGQAGSRIVLEAWQQAIVMNLFGWKKEDGSRRYREAFIYVPRKNGKTTMVAGVVLYMLLADGEPGAEIYSAAADYKQAGLIYEQAKVMALSDQDMSERFKVYKTLKAIEYPGTNSVYRAISADANTKHGFNAHCVVVDELHAQPDRELFDVLETSTGSRRQPMIISITTADYERESICNEKLDYAKKVRDGVIDDPTFLPCIWEADPEADWKAESTWKACNPNYGVSLFPDYLKRLCEKAKAQPTFQNTFKRLHLNIKTNADVSWIQMEAWDRNAGVPVASGSCYGGLDIGAVRDMTSLKLFYPDTGSIFCWYWMARDSAVEAEKRDSVPYLTWARQGRLELTEGNVTDFPHVQAAVARICAEHAPLEVAFDPHLSRQMAQALKDEHGIPMREFQQAYPTFSEPCKAFERYLTAGKIRHGGNPILRWNASNVMLQTDHKGRSMPSKRKSTGRIDGVVAAVMAVGLALRNTEVVWSPEVFVA